jgi:hypothetical protein
MKQCEFPVHYRYTEAVHEDGLYLYEHKYYPVRETACFFFIVPEWQYRNKVIEYKAKKRVSKDGLRRFCYPSKEDALRSFKARKRSQIMHAQDAVSRAKASLKYLDKITIVSESHLNMGRPQFIDNYIFD